eukprot:m.1639049 g.1639049  ORF g.1639049 m.1639049 type:complete len:76 (-) comp32751_c0_seq1:1888-2115(-)
MLDTQQQQHTLVWHSDLIFVIQFRQGLFGNVVVVQHQMHSFGTFTCFSSSIAHQLEDFCAIFGSILKQQSYIQRR